MSRLPLSTLSIALLAAAVLAPSVAQAAKRFEPPTLMMMYRYHQVAAVTAVESPEPGKVRFQRQQMLYGEMPDSELVRVDPELVSELEWGARYVIAYTEVRRNLLDRESPELDPEGPKLVSMPVVGAALLEDSDELRSVFATARSREVDPGAEYAKDLLALLAGSDLRTRRFAIAELYLRPELFAHLGQAQAPALRSVLADPETGSEPRAMLLEATVRAGGAVAGDWLTEIARSVVTEAGVELDLDSTHPLLVKTALEAFQSRAGAADVPTIARHLGSNSPGVAKAALAALGTLDPDAAARRVREVLAGEVHPTTRRALETFLEGYETGQSRG